MLRTKPSGTVPMLLVLFFCAWPSRSEPRAEGEPRLPQMPVLASLPPMGWNSWNFYGDKVTAKDILAAADAIVQSGMRDAGYIYINVDDGWQGERTSDGAIQANKNFPDMKALAQEIHAKGLRFGLYSTPGERSCAGHMGGSGHEQQDAATFAAWGVDFLKYDICSLRQTLAKDISGDPSAASTQMKAAFSRMAEALRATHRPIILSISAHGLAEGWVWGQQAGAQMWRTGDDIKPTYVSIAEIGFQQAGLAPYAAPGAWNDPDMLEIGNGKLSLDEKRTQMSLWALLAAPLIAGNKPEQVDPESLEVLTNREVIAVDQDPLGRQGDRLKAQGPYEIWSKRLADGSVAVGIFNRNAGAATIALPLSSLGWHSAEAVDLWNHEQVGQIIKSRTFLVRSHGVVLLRLKRIQ